MRKTVRNAAIIVSMLLGLAMFNAVVGPFVYWSKVIPHLSPWLGRPKIVPAGAVASFHYLGGGTSWTWRRQVPHGCAEWKAYEDFAVIALSTDCASDDLWFSTIGDDLVFDPYPDPGQIGGQPCSFSRDRSQLDQLAGLARDALRASETPSEKLVLRHVLEHLARVDGDALVTEAGGGCNDLKLADYSRPRQKDFHPDYD